MLGEENIKKISEFAIFCRKLRLDNNQILKDMADVLGVSSSYLSAVENGKRKIPDDWYEKISKSYCLTKDKQDDLFSIIKSQDLQFNDVIESGDYKTKQMLISFARKCQENSITPEKFNEIIKIMEGGKNESVSKK